MTESGAERMLRMARYGFWIRTKNSPYRAVKWVPVRHEDGRQSFRGRNWVEVLAHGEERAPETYYTADVEPAGPHEWLEYYPAVTEPTCGWGRPRLPDGGMQYCPRTRDADQPFCPTHMAEMNEERNLSDDHEHGAGGEPVPAS